MLRVAVARTLAWGLLLSGWVGVAALAIGQSIDPCFAFAALATWLLALGAWTQLLATPRRAALALLAGAGVTAGCWWPGLASEPDPTRFIAGAIGFAAVVVAASMTVRLARCAAPHRPGPPFAAAAAGAALACLILGDPTGDPALLGRRLVVGIASAAALSLALRPRWSGSQGTIGCRAGLFDCTLPSWSVGVAAPARIASLVMLPMMCGLALAGVWCRASNVPPPAMLALHFGAMLLPAWWCAARRIRVEARLRACGPLLATGAIALLAPSSIGGLAVVLVTIAQGAAWSLAWSVQLEGSRKIPGKAARPLRAGAMNAAGALALGSLVGVAGPRVFDFVHGATGIAGIVLATMALIGWPRPRSTVAAR